MTPSQKLRSIADSTGLDGIADAIREIANEIEHNNAPAVPQGWKLVPVEPTREMVEAAFDALPSHPIEGKIRTHYRAMLAATPAPAPAQEPETALQKFTRFKVAETEGNPVEMLRAFCAFAMNSQDWFDVEPFFDLVREAMASRTAVAPAQEVGLMDARLLDWLERQHLEELCMGVVIDAPHDGEYYVNGDDGVTYYGKTLREALKKALRAKGGKL